MQPVGKKAYYVCSPWVRAFHWIMVACMAVLFPTGLYIANPFFLGSLGVEPTYAVSNLFSMENIRFFHFAAGYCLVAACILKVYGFITNKGDRLLAKFWTPHFWTGAIDVFLHYIFLRPTHRPYIRNPLARATYWGVYCLILAEIFTGFAMYSMIAPNSVSAKIFGGFGNEYALHLVHHFIAWLLILFAIVHVYLAIRDDCHAKNGEISSMVSGVKFFKEDPVDVEDVIGLKYKKSIKKV